MSTDEHVEAAIKAMENAPKWNVEEAVKVLAQFSGMTPSVLDENGVRLDDMVGAANSELMNSVERMSSAMSGDPPPFPSNHPSPPTGEGGLAQVNLETPPPDDAKRAAILSAMSTTYPVDGNYICNAIKRHKLAQIGPSTYRRLMVELERSDYVAERGYRHWIVTPAGLEWLRTYVDGVSNG